ncbi:hypothetical protein ACLBXP_25130, partial [Methylobacterium sp. A54F]
MSASARPADPASAERPPAEAPPAGPAPRGPWNPGIESTLPRAFLPLATVHRPENVSTTLADALELASFCGLSAHELVAFRPERLAVHELLIRVMAELSVPLGETYGDLGVNFRAITARILAEDIAPRAAEIAAALDAVRAAAAAAIERELAGILAPEPAPPPAPRGWRARLGLAPPPAPPPAPQAQDGGARAPGPGGGAA